jgi:hypothetical protein
VTEAEFQGAVIEAARFLGWRVAHFRTARTSHGWRTPVAADGAGFPDLCLVRERVLFVELKAEKGRLNDEQGRWLAALGFAGAHVHCWRPSDWPSIEEALR